MTITVSASSVTLSQKSLNRLRAVVKLIAIMQYPPFILRSIFCPDYCTIYSHPNQAPNILLPPGAWTFRGQKVLDLCGFPDAVKRGPLYLPSEGRKRLPERYRGPFLPYSRSPSCSGQSLNSWDGSTGTVIWPSLNCSGGVGQSHHFRMVLGSRPVSR